MKKIKNYSKILGIVGLLCMLVHCYIDWNLTSNLLYYTKNMPRKEEAYPELVLTIENLEVMINPDKEKYRFIEDGANIIVANDDSLKAFGESYAEENIEYMYSDEGDIYRLTNDFKLKSDSYSRMYLDENTTSEEEKKIIKEIQNFIQPVIEKNQNKSQPTINLQWIFDWKYKDRFN